MKHRATLALIATLAFMPQQIEEGFVMSPGGVKLHYRLVGTGRDTIVVIADGPAGSINAIAPDLAALTRRHRVVFYDQRGSGTSSAPAELRLDDHVRDLEALRMYVGMRTMRIIAHGWGAAIASQYAARHPENVSRMVLVAPLPIRRDLQDRAQAALLERLDDDAIDRLVGARAHLESAPDPVAACRGIIDIERPALMALPVSTAAVRGSPCNAPAEAVRFALATGAPAGWSSLAVYDFRPSLTSVTAMTLVIHGEQDVTPALSAEEWSLAIPNARLLRVAGAGRYPHVEQAATVMAAVDTLLAGRWPAGAIATPRIATDW